MVPIFLLSPRQNVSSLAAESAGKARALISHDLAAARETLDCTHQSHGFEPVVPAPTPFAFPNSLRSLPTGTATAGHLRHLRASFSPREERGGGQVPAGDAEAEGKNKSEW